MVAGLRLDENSMAVEINREQSSSVEGGFVGEAGDEGKGEAKGKG